MEKELHATPDAKPFSGESRCWPREPSRPAPRSRRGSCARWIGGHSSRPPAGRAEGYARDAGVGLEPAYSLRSCPAQCPPAGISTASTWPTGPTTALRPRIPASPRRRCPTPPWRVASRCPTPPWRVASRACAEQMAAVAAAVYASAWAACVSPPLLLTSAAAAASGGAAGWAAAAARGHGRAVAAAAAPATTCWAAPYPGPARGPHRLGRRGNPTLRRASTAHRCGGRSCLRLGRAGPGGHPPRRRRATSARRGRGTRTEGRRTAPSATSRPSKFWRKGTAQGSSCRRNEYAGSRPTPASRA